MALGKNLKKGKLIPEKKEKDEKQDRTKKVAVKKKKELIKGSTSAKEEATPSAQKKTRVKPQEKKKAKTKKQTPKERKPAKAQSPEQQAPEDKFNAGLPLFIAQKLYDRKQILRKKYQEEIVGLKGAKTQFVFFEIGEETYAVSIDVVKEVVPITKLSRTPNTPPHILGIAKVRSSTFVVFDLSIKFRVNAGQEPAYLLVVREKGIVASITLNRLPTTVRIGGDQISSKMQLIEDASLDVSYIKGLIQHEDRLVYYLDIIELLRNDRAIVVPDSLEEHIK